MDDLGAITTLETDGCFNRFSRWIKSLMEKLAAKTCSVGVNLTASLTTGGSMPVPSGCVGRWWPGNCTEPGPFAILEAALKAVAVAIDHPGSSILLVVFPLAHVPHKGGPWGDTGLSCT